MVQIDLFNEGYIDFIGNEITSSSSVESLVILGATEEINIFDSVIDNSENDGKNYLQLIQSKSVTIENFVVHDLLGSTSIGKSIIYINLLPNADFSIYGCHFYNNVLKKTIMFELVSHINNFMISECIFTNETLSNVYIESTNDLNHFNFQHSIIESIGKYSHYDIGVVFLKLNEL